jgi:hypothetical protein
MKPKTIYDPTFKVTFRICYGWSEKDFKAALKKHGYKDEDELYEGKAIIFDRMIWIWTRRRSLPEYVHEIVHAVIFILIDRGITLSDDSDELFAYLVEMLFREGRKK